MSLRRAGAEDNIAATALPPPCYWALFLPMQGGQEGKQCREVRA